jgi:hypothetical protein
MQPTWIDDVIEHSTEQKTYVIGMSIGLLGKISYEIFKKRTLSVVQWLAVVGMSIFAGYMVSVYCQNNGMHQSAQFLVPISTLLGEKMFIYLFTNYKAILGGIFNLIIRPK